LSEALVAVFVGKGLHNVAASNRVSHSTGYRSRIEVSSPMKVRRYPGMGAARPMQSAVGRTHQQ
jgi:hypothetical protein